MAVVSLKSSPACRDFWQQRIQLNLAYWQGYLAQHSVDTAALEQEWQTVVRAILLGLDLPAAWPDVFRLTIDFSGFMERRGYWDAWQNVLYRALLAATQAQDKAGEITLSTLLARLHQRQGQVRPMIASYRRTIRLARRHGDDFNEGRACTNLGYFYVERGQWYRAEVLCCHALQIFEQIDNDHGMAHTYNHLGALYIRQNRWNEAEKHLGEAYDIWRATGDSFGQMSALVNFGTLYMEIRNFSKCLHYSMQALQRAESLGDELTSGTIHVNIGAAHRLAGDLEKAERHARQAETVFRRLANRYGLALVLDNLGLIYLGQQKWDESKAYLQMALKYWQDLGNKLGEIRAMAYLAEYGVARGNHPEAQVWLIEAEQQLQAYDLAGQYQQLHEQVKRIRRSLPEIQPGKLRRSKTEVN